MPYCSKCGAEMDETAEFCPKCGAPAGAMAKAEHKVRGVKEKREEACFGGRQEACFGPPGSGGGLWGAISFGVFIIGLGILWIFDFFWPGILILIGLMIFLGALVAVSRR